MRKRILLFITVLLVTFLVVVIFLNHRYPFYVLEPGPWSVGFSSVGNLRKGNFGKNEKLITYEDVSNITPEVIHYIADPFFIKEGNDIFLFAELKGDDNANIGLFQSTIEGELKYKGVILDEEFHLSYPQVFKYKEEYYMLPETKGANQVLLYKSENFPYSWRVVDTLLKNRRLKDPTLLLSEEINLIVAADDDLKQYFFTSDSLRGDWREVENYEFRSGNETRPGGRFFRFKGDWYLPVQNRSRGYGTGISLYKLEITEELISLNKEYHMFLGPQEHKWFNRGMHHLDVQVHDDRFYMAYDGDRNLNNKKSFQFKRTLKLAWMDFYNLFQD